MTEPACNKCVTCCKQQIVAIMPEDEANMRHYQVDELPLPSGPLKILRSKPNGDCAHLSDSGCSIYDHRPMVCRAYDCRKQFKIMSRNERRQFKNSAVWDEARKRLHTLDANDLRELADYRNRATCGQSRAISLGDD